MRFQLIKSLFLRQPRKLAKSTNRSLHCELLEDRQLLTAQVVSTLPLTGSMGVPVNANIEATFDSPIASISVTDQTFVIYGSQSGRLLSSHGDINSLGSTGNTVTLDPTNSFFPGELVQVTSTTGVLDSSSVSAASHVWDFRAATVGGSGTFVDSGQELGDGASWHVALGDVDRDGDLDAFVTNLFLGDLPPQYSRLWLNQGGAQGGIAGQFVDSGQLLDNIRPHDLALGDLDGDGDLDVFIGNSGDRPNTVWFNQGGQQGGIEGHFTDSGQRLGNSNISNPSVGRSTRGVFLGDLDGDGDLDTFAVNRGNQANIVWINQGGIQGGIMGQFQDSGQELGSSTSFAIELGDLDGDGDLDAFVANGAPLGTSTTQPNEVWLNDGYGTFTDSGQRLGNFNSYDVSLGDLDADGDLDAFVANQEPNSNRFWINQGGAQGGTAGQFHDSGQILSSAGGVFDAAIGDLDADGDLDIFIVYGSTYPNIIWINQGGLQAGIEGQFADSGQRLLKNSNSRGVALGDLDNDGDLDAFVTNYTTVGVGRPNTVWLNQNTTADFDQDGDVDGADFLTWQRGFGLTTGANIHDGDANADGDVDGVDLTIWGQQYGKSYAPITVSLEINGLKTSENLGLSEPATAILRRYDLNSNIWLELPNITFEHLSLALPPNAVFASESALSRDIVDSVLENLYFMKGGRERRSFELHPLSKDIEELAILHVFGDTSGTENIDSILNEWDGIG